MCVSVMDCVAISVHPEKSIFLLAPVDKYHEKSHFGPRYETPRAVTAFPAARPCRKPNLFSPFACKQALITVVPPAAGIYQYLGVLHIRGDSCLEAVRARASAAAREGALRHVKTRRRSILLSAGRRRSNQRALVAATQRSSG